MTSWWGIDIGGTTTVVGRISGGGFEIVEVLPTPAGGSPADHLSRLASVIGSEDPSPNGIGVGAAGLVDREAGLLVSSPNMPAWRDVDLISELGALCRGNVVIDNDSNVFAYGAVERGEIPSSGLWAMITLGTGIGGTIVDSGTIVYGRGYAGEFGHMSIIADGIECPCGSTGCWEQYASKSALIRYFYEYSGGREETEPKVIASLARNGDQAAAEASRELGWWLGVGLANIGYCLDPDGFVLGGGLAGSFSLFEKPCAEVYERRTGRDLRVVVLRNVEQAGAMGAAAMARDSGPR